MRSSALSEGEDAAPGIATRFPLIPLLAGRRDRAFPIGNHEGLVLFWPLSSSSSCLLHISSLLHPDWGEPQPPSWRAASPAGRRWGGREGKAAARRLCSLAEHRAEASCGSAAPTFVGMAARYETARLRSNATGLPSLTKNAVVLARGKQQQLSFLKPWQDSLSCSFET